MDNKNPRSKKATKAQMELIINYLENNRVLTTGKMHPHNISEIESKWDELANLLNGIDKGARKDKKQWKTFLYEWKSKTKKKARNNTEAIRQTGGGGYICEELTDIENRLLKVFGWVHVVGCPEAPLELDPDADATQTYIEVPLDIQNIEMGQDINDDNIEITVSEVLTVPKGLTETKENDVSRTVPKYQTPKKRKNVTELEKSAEAYCKGSHEMAEAMKEMSLAMREMAVAVTQLSQSLMLHKVE